jgi:hypothetical protein
MRKDLDTWAAQIAEAVRADPNGPSFASWQSSVAALKKALDPLREKLVALRDRKPWSPPAP